MREIEYFTTKEAAEILGVGASTVRRWAAQGKIMTIRTPGGHNRIPKMAVASLILKQTFDEENKRSEEVYQKLKSEVDNLINGKEIKD